MTSLCGVALEGGEVPGNAPRGKAGAAGSGNPAESEPFREEILTKLMKIYRKVVRDFWIIWRNMEKSITDISE